MRRTSRISLCVAFACENQSTATGAAELAWRVTAGDDGRLFSEVA